MSRLSTTTSDSDAEQVVALIEWAHSNGVEMSAVAVGSCTVTLMPRRGSARQDENIPERMANTAYSQFGGALLKEIPEVMGDLEPVVGRR